MILTENSLEHSEIVAHKLTSKDRPIHPEKLWLGKVIRYFGRGYILVEIVEPGYENMGLREIIEIGQVQNIGKERGV